MPKIVAALGAVVVWVVDVVLWRFDRVRGADLSGDEPHYLVLARMLGHGSLHPMSAYAADVRTHALFAWAPQIMADPVAWHAFGGPHGLVSIHGLGLPLLLAPFVAVGGAAGGAVGLMALEAAAWVYVMVRACALAGLRWRCGPAVAAVVAGPAVWLASSQLYPDFPAGLLLALALVEVAAAQRAGPSRWGSAGAGLCLGLLPWLHIKNLVPAVAVLAALLAVARSAWPAVIPGVSWVVLLAYNLWGFGRVLGEPQPGPRPSWAALTHGVGMLLDRHQGLAVQVPAVILGVVGLALARRAFPVAVGATVVSVASLLYLDATYVGVPYGGTSLAGRFTWSDLAPLLMWVPVLLARLRGARLVAVATVVSAVWVVQLVPILRGRHTYYNDQIGGPPWDPAQYPGWWGRLDRALPELVPHGPQWGLPARATALAVVLAGVVAVAGWLVTSRPAWVAAGGGLAGVAAVGVVAMTAGPLPLPARPLTYPGAAVGSPLITGPAPGPGAAVALSGVGRGTYAVTTTYTLTGTATVTVSCAGGTAQSVLVVGGAPVVSRVQCRSGLLHYATSAGPSSRLDVATVSLARTG